MARLALIPPDAPIDLRVDCGRGGSDCVSLGGLAAAPLPADEAAALGPPVAQGAGARFRIDPVADGGRLRRVGAVPARGANVASPAGAGAKPAFDLMIESAVAAPVPSELTPEEIERLRSLGYVH